MNELVIVGVSAVIAVVLPLMIYKLIYRMVSWDYDKIRECVSNMKVGETKILEA